MRVPGNVPLMYIFVMQHVTNLVLPEFSGIPLVHTMVCHSIAHDPATPETQVTDTASTQKHSNEEDTWSCNSEEPRPKKQHTCKSGNSIRQAHSTTSAPTRSEIKHFITKSYYHRQIKQV